jgi:hypothetical protein
MTVDQARGQYQEDALVARLGVTCWRIEPAECNTCKRFLLAVDAASIALDTATARAISGSDTPGAGPTWSQRWRTRQQVRWSDALHRTLLKSVAY